MATRRWRSNNVGKVAERSRSEVLLPKMRLRRESGRRPP